MLSAFLKDHPISKYFFRQEWIEKMYTHLHQHHRKAESEIEQLSYDIKKDKIPAKRGELLRCFTKETLCCEPIYWLSRSMADKSNALYAEAEYHDTKRKSKRVSMSKSMSANHYSTSADTNKDDSRSSIAATAATAIIASSHEHESQITATSCRGTTCITQTPII